MLNLGVPKLWAPKKKVHLVGIGSTNQFSQLYSLNCIVLYLHSLEIAQLDSPYPESQDPSHSDMKLVNSCATLPPCNNVHSLLSLAVCHMPTSLRMVCP